MAIPVPRVARGQRSVEVGLKASFRTSIMCSPAANRRGPADPILWGRRSGDPPYLTVPNVLTTNYLSTDMLG